MELIAAILSFETSNELLSQRLESNNIDWEQFVKLSSEQLVMTTCYCRLAQKQALDAIPEDLKLYLEEVTSINRQRNLKLIDEIKVITQTFNTNNIDYVLLKGAALLMGNSFQDIGERMVGDVDILVSSKHINKAFQLISTIGYDQSKDFNYTINDFRHLPRQFTDDKLAVIELHSSVLDPKFKHLLDDDAVLNTKIAQHNVFIPTPYYANLINIMGLQVNSKGYQYRHWFLRNMYDSLVLKLDSQTDLLLDYKDNLYVIDYLSKCQAIFSSVTFEPENQNVKRKTKYYTFKLKHFWWHQLLYKSKYIFYSIYDRIRLFIKNSSYRKLLYRHLFNKSTSCF
nr:nucleotidyltransferase family protein [Psychroserpens sp. SPM9]